MVLYGPRTALDLHYAWGPRSSPQPHNMPDAIRHRADFEHLINGFDGAIMVWDHFGRLLEILEELGIAGETAIIVSADHGESFGENGSYAEHRMGAAVQRHRRPAPHHRPAAHVPGTGRPDAQPPHRMVELLRGRPGALPDPMLTTLQHGPALYNDPQKYAQHLRSTGREYLAKDLEERLAVAAGTVPVSWHASMPGGHAIAFFPPPGQRRPAVPGPGRAARCRGRAASQLCRPAGGPVGRRA